MIGKDLDILNSINEEIIEIDNNNDSETEFEHYKFIIDPGQSSIRIDKFITTHIENTSRHRVQLSILAGNVRVNQKIIKANYKIRPDDIITIVLPYERRGFEVKPEDIPLNIVYEDNDILLVNKVAGMVVHPAHGHFTGTLINALAYYLGITQEADASDERMGVLVHRIDKNTSGLLVIAKNDESQLKLAKQFFDHSIDRKYIAIVWGNLKEDSGTISAHIGRDPNNRQKYKIYPDGDFGKHAVTHYKVMERLGYVTIVECQLETGRTHQIRVHMNYLGHPLFNDITYGGDKILKGTVYSKYKQFIDNCFKILPRHALHAKNLGFDHPITGKKVFIDSELPQDMQDLIQKWRDYVKVKAVLEEE